MAKACVSRLAGLMEVPGYEEKETSFADFKILITQTIKMNDKEVVDTSQVLFAGCD